MYIPFSLECFEIKGMLGKGAEGEVYLLYDKRECLYVAAKVSKDIDRLKQQKMWMERLGDGICPRVYAFETVGEYGILYMEYVLGETLEQYRMRKGTADVREAADIVLKVVEAIEYVHKLGAIYLDIKPANLYLRSDGRICLLDFGAAKEAGSYGMVLGGTKGYAAPEQFLPGTEADERCDVYAIGKLMVYLMTNNNPAYPPYGEEGMLQELPDFVRKIVTTCTDCDIRKRYANLCILKRVLCKSMKKRRNRIF